MSDVIPVSALTLGRPRWWQDPYGTLLRAAILVGWVPGFTLGLVLMLELALFQRVGIGWWPHAQTHAHAQLYGFVGLFFFGVATQILPRFLGHGLVGRTSISVGGALLGASLIGRLSVQPFPPGQARDVLLLVTGVAGLLGAFMIVVPFARTTWLSNRPRERWQLLLALGLLSWLAGSAASCWSSIALARGQLLIPEPVHELTLHFGLWGFAVPVTMAVGLRVFPNFLLLRPGPARSQISGIAVYAMGVLVVAGAWLSQTLWPEAGVAGPTVRVLGWVLMATGGVVLVGSLRIFEPPARESVSPHITAPTRFWFRVAYGYFLIALISTAVVTGRELLTGDVPSATEVSALRHSLAMGYLMPLIIGMAGRILPEFSAEMTRHPRALATLVWLWLIGAGLRVGGELWSGYSGPGAVLMMIGASLAFIGFIWFSIRLWLSIGRRRPEAYAL